MISTALDAAAMADKLAQRLPGAYELALVVSIAARVEPELLRVMRLRLLPRLAADDEADLWLSACVESQSALWMLLHPRLAEELRGRLAKKPELATRARELVRELHATAPPLIQLEETIHWLSLSGPARRAEVEGTLGPVLHSLRQPDDDGVAQWAARAIPRLSIWVRDLPISWAIRVVAEQRLGGSVLLDRDAPAVSDEVAAILRDLLPMRDIWVRLSPDGLEVSRERILGGHAISVPATEPIALQLGEGRGWKWIELRDAVKREPFPFPLKLRTLTGATYELAPVEKTPRSYVSIRWSAINGVDSIGLAFEQRPDLMFIGALTSLADVESLVSLGYPGPDGPIVLALPAAAPLADFDVRQLQALFHGAREIRFGTRLGDFAATIEIDGALLGIVGITGLPEPPFEQVYEVCDGDVGAWVARHHATILFTHASLREISKSTGMQVILPLFSLHLQATHSPPDVSMPSRILPSIQLGSWKLRAGELRIGVPPMLVMHKPAREEIPIRMRISPPMFEVRPPNRWVLVAGSSPDLDEFGTEVTRAIGQQLARAGLGLITSGWPGVDEIVALAFADVLETRGADAVSQSLQQVLGEIQPRPEVPGQRILMLNEEGAVREAVSRADAVVLIAGYAGTRWIGTEARRQNKVLVPIAATGGVAAEMFTQSDTPLPASLKNASADRIAIDVVDFVRRTMVELRADTRMGVATMASLSAAEPASKRRIASRPPSRKSSSKAPSRKQSSKAPSRKAGPVEASASAGDAGSDLSRGYTSSKARRPIQKQSARKPQRRKK